jgi:glycosyltransferase involved in cell wall biosynthesis
MKTIYHIGVFPPPIGGISIYFERLKSLHESNNIPGLFIDISNTNYVEKRKNGILCFNKIQLLKLLNIVNNSVLFFNSTRKVLFYYSIYACRKNELGIFLHGEKILKLIKNTIYLKLLHNFKYIIVPTDSLYKKILKIDPKLSKNMVKLSYVFFNQASKYPSIKMIDNLRNNKNKIMLFYIYDFSKINDKYTYGIEMIPDLISLLNNNAYKFVILILVIKKEPSNDYKNFINELSVKKMFDNIILIDNTNNMLNLLSKVDLYIRPTITDGNAFMVHEALFVGTPVIASDIVERPLGCINYKNGDVFDLYMKTSSVLDQDNIDEIDRNDHYADNYNQIISFLRKVSNQIL